MSKRMEKPMTPALRRAYATLARAAKRVMRLQARQRAREAAGGDERMNLREMVTAWLTEQGYDGLHNAERECGCETADLFPCEGPDVDCTAGTKTPCDGQCESGRCPWHMGPGKNDAKR